MLGLGVKKERRLVAKARLFRTQLVANRVCELSLPSAKLGSKRRRVRSALGVKQGEASAQHALELAGDRTSAAQVDAHVGVASEHAFDASKHEPFLGLEGRHRDGGKDGHEGTAVVTRLGWRLQFPLPGC